MIEPRLATHIRVQALLRRTTSYGGFGCVLRKGDTIAGTLLVQLLEKGQNPVLYEQAPSFDGPAEWRETLSQDPEKHNEIQEYLERRINNDPDIWVIELDIPDRQRFVDTILAEG